MGVANQTGPRLIFVVFALAAAPAHSNEPTAIDYGLVPHFKVSRPSVLTRPDALRYPDSETIGRAFPSKALAAEVNGRADLACRVTITGVLRDCVVSWEAPKGYGFGKAAMKLSTSFRMRPATRDGTPIEGGYVLVPFNFTAFPGQAPAPSDPNPALPGSRDPASPAPPALAMIALPAGRLHIVGVTDPGPSAAPYMSRSMTFIEDVKQKKRVAMDVTLFQVIPAPRPYEATYTVSRMGVDCRLQRILAKGSRSYDASGRPLGWGLAFDEHPVTIDPTTSGGFAAQIACNKVKPLQSVEGVEAALAVALGLPE